MVDQKKRYLLRGISETLGTCTSSALEHQKKEKQTFFFRKLCKVCQNSVSAHLAFSGKYEGCSRNHTMAEIQLIFYHSLLYLQYPQR